MRFAHHTTVSPSLTPLMLALIPLLFFPKSRCQPSFFDNQIFHHRVVGCWRSGVWFTHEFICVCRCVALDRGFEWGAWISPEEWVVVLRHLLFGYCGASVVVLVLFILFVLCIMSVLVCVVYSPNCCVVRLTGGYVVLHRDCISIPPSSAPSRSLSVFIYVFFSPFFVFVFLRYVQI